MAEFMLLTRVWENQSTGEITRDPFLVNLAHVRTIRPNQAGGTWVDWNAATAPPTKVVQDFEAIAGAMHIYTSLQIGPPDGP